MWSVVQFFTGEVYFSGSFDDCLNFVQDSPYDIIFQDKDYKCINVR